MDTAYEMAMQECQQLRGIGLDVEIREDAVLVKALPLPGQKIWTNAIGVTVCRVPVLIGLDAEAFPQGDAWFGPKHPNHALHLPFLKYDGRELHGLCHCECDYSLSGWEWLRFTRRPPYMREDNLVSLICAIQFSLLERATLLLSPEQNYL
jgi:hypothetical protein